MDNKVKSQKFFKIFIIYFVVLFAFVFVRIASNFGVFSGIGNEIVSDLVSTLLIQVVILLAIPFLLYKILFKKSTKQISQDFGFKKLSAKAILICFGIGALAFVLNLFVSNFFSNLLHSIGYNPQGTGSGSGYNTFPKFLYGVFSVAILPAICEEFLHRGLVLRGASDVVGFKKAIVISSVLFGLMHLNIQQFFYATILGLLMGLVATMTRSIWPAIIMHFCNNFINVFLSYAETSNLFGFSIDSAINTLAGQSVLMYFIVSALIIFLVVTGIVALLRKLFMETGAKKYNKMFEEVEAQIRAIGGENMTDKDVVFAFERFVMPNLKSPNNVFDLYIADNKHYRDLNLKYKIPLISCFVLAIAITVFTFIWGVI